LTIISLIACGAIFMSLSLSFFLHRTHSLLILPHTVVIVLVLHVVVAVPAESLAPVDFRVNHRERTLPSRRRLFVHIRVIKTITIPMDRISTPTQAHSRLHVSDEQ
jgi:hypothetical protein